MIRSLAGPSQRVCIAARSNITEGPTTEDSGDPESRMVLVATHSAMSAAG